MTPKASLTRPEQAPSTAVPATSTRELRTFLLEQIVAVADGKQKPDTAKAICNYAQQVYNTVSLELRHASTKSKLTGGATIEPVSFVAS